MRVNILNIFAHSMNILNRYLHVIPRDLALSFGGLLREYVEQKLISKSIFSTNI